jgi:lysozyme
MKTFAAFLKWLGGFFSEPVVDQAISTMEIAIALCKRFEGFRSKPYLCPAGVPTIGYGTTVYPSGIKVTLFDADITQASAEEMLVYALKRVYLPAVMALCPDLEGDRQDAILDFCYNLGESNLRISTLRKKLNEGDFEAAREEILRWNKAGGRTLKGLTLRREAERNYI